MSTNKPIKKHKSNINKSIDKFDSNLHKYKHMLLIDKHNISTPTIQHIRETYKDSILLISIKGSILRKLYDINNSDTDNTNIKYNFIICLTNDINIIKSYKYYDYLLEDEKNEKELLVNILECKNRKVLEYINTTNNSIKDNNNIKLFSIGQIVNKKDIEIMKILQFKGILRKLHIIGEYNTDNIHKK